MSMRMYVKIIAKDTEKIKAMLFDWKQQRLIEDFSIIANEPDKDTSALHRLIGCGG